MAIATTTVASTTTTTVVTTTSSTTTTTVPADPEVGWLTDNVVDDQLEIIWPLDLVAETLGGFLANGRIMEIPLSQLVGAEVCLKKKGGSYNQVCVPFDPDGVAIVYPADTTDFWLFLDDGLSGQYWLWIDTIGTPFLPRFATSGIQPLAAPGDAWLGRGSP